MKYVFGGVGMLCGLGKPVLQYTGGCIGIFSNEYRDAPWSWDKFLDFLSRAWLPIFLAALATIYFTESKADKKKARA